MEYPPIPNALPTWFLMTEDQFSGLQTQHTERLKHDTMYRAIYNSNQGTWYHKKTNPVPPPFNIIKYSNLIPIHQTLNQI